MAELCRLSFGSIVRCQECGLVRVFPPRSSEQLAHLHNTPEFFNDPYFDKRDLSRAHFVAERRAVLDLLADSRTVQGARILDIGCDTGSLLTIAQDEFGMTGVGVDVSEQAIRIAREQYGLEVLLGQINELRLPRASFDFIVMMDVIEHVADPAVLLGEVHQLLRDGGKVYIATSEHDAFITTIGLALYRLFRARARGFLEKKLYVPYHEFYFTQSTLARLVKQSGFHITHHAKKEFPIQEVHGILLKMALAPVFAIQYILGKQALQELVAIKTPGATLRRGV